MAVPAGPPATINREPGQARKGAATAVDLGAGVWLVGAVANTPLRILVSRSFNSPLESPLSKRAIPRFREMPLRHTLIVARALLKNPLADEMPEIVLWLQLVTLTNRTQPKQQ
jgi:hypothetical protein